MAQFVSGTPSVYQPIIAAAAATYGVPTLLLSALLKQESGFDPNAVSLTGAEGIAQFEPGTAASLGVNPNDPTSAINGAAKLLAQLQQQFGSWGLALAAYNAGAGAVQSAGNSVPNNGQTPAYVEDIASMLGLASVGGPAGAVAAIDSAMGSGVGGAIGGAVSNATGVGPAITQAEQTAQSWLTRFAWMALAAVLIWVGLFLLVFSGAMSHFGSGAHGAVAGAHGSSSATAGDQVEDDAAGVVE